jgi:hypothetical protein
VLDEVGIRFYLYRVESVLIGLDLIQTSQGTWTAGPSARWLLPRTTAIAHLWSRQSSGGQDGSAGGDLEGGGAGELVLPPDTEQTFD